MTGTDPFQACTLQHCTRGEVGQMYSSGPFLVGALVVGAVAVALFAARGKPGARAVRWIAVLGLVGIGFMGMRTGARA